MTRGGWVAVGILIALGVVFAALMGWTFGGIR
jgi:hypothetical protein